MVATVEEVERIDLSDLPESVRAIKGPPPQLYMYGRQSGIFQQFMGRHRVAVVGTRKISPYGEAVTRQLVTELAAQGVVIVSGLAIGTDGAAHLAALEAGGSTVAVLPGPVQDVYPKSNRRLAQSIVNSGGLLVSEYPEGAEAFKQNFVARNRIVTALSEALLIIEATEQSGTLHTARFALDQGITVLAVPGNITSPTSDGTNNLLKAGATPVTCTDDILHVLDMAPRSHTGRVGAKRIRGANQEEQRIIDLLEQGITEGNELLRASGLRVEVFNHHLTMLELTTKIRPLGANCWGLG